MRSALVKIDTTRLNLRLWLSTGRSLGEWELRQWLEQAGFKWSSGSWYRAEGDPDLLRPDEVLERQTLETSDGITFIEREIPETPGPHAS